LIFANIGQIFRYLIFFTNIRIFLITATWTTVTRNILIFVKKIKYLNICPIFANIKPDIKLVILFFSNM
jgi:hypothetical protein